MKSIINKEEEKKEFPSLRESVSGNIFYCIDEKTSVCLIARSGGFVNGQLCNPTASKLTPFKGTITLSND